MMFKDLIRDVSQLLFGEAAQARDQDDGNLALDRHLINNQLSRSIKNALDSIDQVNGFGVVKIDPEQITSVDARQAYVEVLSTISQHGDINLVFEFSAGLGKNDMTREAFKQVLKGFALHDDLIISLPLERSYCGEDFYLVIGLVQTLNEMPHELTIVAPQQWIDGSDTGAAARRFRSWRIGDMAQVISDPHELGDPRDERTQGSPEKSD